MQLGRQFIPTAAKFDHVFSKNMKRNRVELVSDFPNDAEVISSLQVYFRANHSDFHNLDMVFIIIIHFHLIF